MGGYPSAENQLVYSTTPANWATGHSLGESYPAVENQSVYSTAPADQEMYIVLFQLFLSTTSHFQIDLIGTEMGLSYIL